MTEIDTKSLEEQIVATLKTIYDPEIPVNIYELGLVYEVRVDPSGEAHIKMTLTAPNCPAAPSLPEEVRRKSELVEGVTTAKVEIVFDPQWTPDKMNDSAKLILNIL
jgi:FeS assembly SUF system protein